jgi:hypothetical protein
MKRLTVVLCWAAACAALAAPLPMPKGGPFESGWDRPIDPDKDCVVTRKSHRVTMELPAGKPHLLHRGGQWPLMNAPRLLRDVKGDFIAEARLTSDWNNLSVLSSHRRRAPQVRAGLVFLPAHKGEEGGHYSVQYGSRREGKALVRFAYTDLDDLSCICPQTAEPRLPPAGTKSVYVRLVRKGKSVSGWVSADGRHWLKQGPIEEELPESLPERGKVGLVACSTSLAKFKVTFDRFKLTPLKPKGR